MFDRWSEVYWDARLTKHSLPSLGAPIKANVIEESRNVPIHLPRLINDIIVRDLEIAF